MKLTYTVSEASKVLGIGRTKMYELVSNGEIRSIRFGDAIRISKSYIDELINPQTQQGQTNDRSLHLRNELQETER